MARTKNKLLDIEKELNKMLKPALKQTAIDLNQMIEDYYEFAIMAFYMDYEPRYYRRTYSTYYASSLYENESEIVNPKAIGNNMFEAGISVGASNIPGEPYKKGRKNRPDKEWVFNRTYRLGIHGTTQPEQSSWGKNDYWIKYLKYVRNFDGTLNQYKNVRNKKYGKSKKKIKAMGFSKDFTYTTAAKMYGWKIGNTARVLIPDTYVFGKSQMVGRRNKPIYIFEDNYKKLTGKRNINKLISDNIIYLLSK